MVTVKFIGNYGMTSVIRCTDEDLTREINLLSEAFAPTEFPRWQVTVSTTNQPN